METQPESKPESKSLVTIMNDHFAMNELLGETEGELDQTTEQWLEENKENLGKKADGYKSAMEILSNAAAYLKDKAKPFTAAAKVCENKHDALKDRLKFAMKVLDLKQIEGTDWVFSLVDGQNKVVVDKEDDIPAKYFREINVVELDRDLLKKDLEALKEGETIPGCHLELVQSLKSKVNATTIKPKKVKAPKGEKSEN